ncbi:MAG: hypothetical protein OJF50_000584 [Nitrospira sp.]|nr:hypothetical protein [Nitrospira sp.]
MESRTGQSNGPSSDDRPLPGACNVLAGTSSGGLHINGFGLGLRRFR